MLTRNLTVSASRPQPQADGPGAAAQPRVIMLDADRRIIDESVPAAALLDAERALVRSFGRLDALCRSDARALEQALQAADRLGASRITIGEGADTLEIDLVRMRGAADRPCFLVIARLAEDQRQQRVTEAAAAYGLTAAEKRLLAILFDGCSLPEAAHRLGVARSTARTHLQRLFDKTGARRQAELLRTIALAEGAFA